MEKKKSLDELLNEATAISSEREEEVRMNAIKIANELLKDCIVKKEN